MRTLASIAVAFVVVSAAIIGAGLRSAPSYAQPFTDLFGGDGSGAPGHGIPPPRTDDGVVDEQDGVLPDGVTAFDDHLPGVANLSPGLLQAVRVAATDAAADGVVLYVNSGWRSREHQDHLRREAVVQHGSEEEAARWVAPDTSAHLSGDAVDVGHADARSWLSQHGARYGLCQTYANEPWHYELRPDAVDLGCPAAYPDPTHDPRNR